MSNEEKKYDDPTKDDLKRALGENHHPKNNKIEPMEFRARDLLIATFIILLALILFALILLYLASVNLSVILKF